MQELSACRHALGESKRKQAWLENELSQVQINSNEKTSIHSPRLSPGPSRQAPPGIVPMGDPHMTDPRRTDPRRHPRKPGDASFRPLHPDANQSKRGASIMEAEQMMRGARSAQHWEHPYANTDPHQRWRALSPTNPRQFQLHQGAVPHQMIPGRMPGRP